MLNEYDFKITEKLHEMQIINFDLLTKKTWGPEFELFAKWVVSEHFTHFTANYYLKTRQEKQEDNLTDEICYLEYICSPEQPLISKTSQ